MVSSQQEEVFGVLDFVSQQKTNALYGLLSSIDVISQEKVVSISREASIFK